MFDRQTELSKKGPHQDDGLKKTQQNTQNVFVVLQIHFQKAKEDAGRNKSMHINPRLAEGGRLSILILNASW